MSKTTLYIAMGGLKVGLLFDSCNWCLQGVTLVSIIQHAYTMHCESFHFPVIFSISDIEKWINEQSETTEGRDFIEKIQEIADQTYCEWVSKIQEIAKRFQ